MNTDTTTTEPRQDSPPPARQLVRPHEGRILGGVAAGIGNHLGISPLLVRIAFAITLFFGGLGLVAYAAGWLLIRDEREPEPIAQRLVDNIRSGPAWIGVVLILLAAAILLDRVTYLSGSFLWATVLLIAGVLLYRGDLSRPRATPPEIPGGASGSATAAGPVEGPPPPPPNRPVPPASISPPLPVEPPPPRSILGRLTAGVVLLALGALAVADNLTTLIDPRPRHYLAVATVVVGLGLLVGAWVGRARWMILLGVLLLPPLLASPVAELDWRTDLRAEAITPASVDDLAGSYDTAAARWVFNLTEIPWAGETASFDVSLGAGEIVVVVPPDVAVTGTARVGVGEIETPSLSRAGVGELRTTLQLAGESGTVDVDLSVAAGRIEVVRADEFNRFGNQFSSSGDVSAAPTTLAELRDIEVRSGDVELDLTGLDLTGLDLADYEEASTLQILVGAGDIDVVVPDDMYVSVFASSGVGRVSLFGNTLDGLAVSDWQERSAGPGPGLNLNLQAGVGNVTVTERNP